MTGLATNGPPLASIATGPSFTEATVELLRERILGGEFAPGTRLVEAEIARQLRISRGPVREAIAMLRAEGLAYEEPRRGSFVARLSIDDVREIYELRSALEAEAARLLCSRGDESAFTALEDLVERLAATVDRAEFANLDFRLHEELCRRAGNGRLLRVWKNQVGVLRTLVKLEVARQHETLEPLLAEHRWMVAEIASRDPLRAAAACQAHARGALVRATEMLEPIFEQQRESE